MHRLLQVLLLTTLTVGLPQIALAQSPTPRPEPTGAAAAGSVERSQLAESTREQLHRVLRQYPPTVLQVLRVDPALATRADYLATYPALREFLEQHPDVARNPSYYFGSFVVRETDPRERAYEMFGVLLAGIAGSCVFAALVGLLVWLVRAMIDHRRWLRVSRVQTDVHSKLIDRMTSNEELLAYIQSSPGRRFLESAPLAVGEEARPTTAPFNRILWSLQAGIVLVALGVGFRIAQQNVLQEVADGFHVFGVVAISLGIGFAVSAVASYVISSRAGLIQTSKP